MVGYSALTQRDEALALQLIRDTERIVRSVLGGHGGREIKTLGDGFLLEFGSALSATECAIEIQRAIHDHNMEPGVVSIDLRIGIHVGDVERRDGDILGDAVNIASRVEALAEPGGVCLTGAVVEQVENKIRYPCRELGVVALKNLTRPVSVSHVALPWIEGGEAGLTPWTDRQRELQIVANAISAARRHKGRVLFIRGEPGIGKTRLVQEALRLEPRSGLQVLRARALPGEPCPPYGYWAEVAREFFRTAPPALALKICGECGSEVVKLVPELADRLESFASPPGLDADQERSRFYEGIGQLFLNISKESPLVVFFDDVQWADTSSLRMLQFIGRRLPQSQLLIVATCRDYDPQENPVLREVVEDLDHQHWGTSLVLSRLPMEDVAKIAESILGSLTSTPQFAPQLFQKTGGNPFFLEEVLRNVLESGQMRRGGSATGSPVPELQFPENVRHVIHLRLGRLNPKTVEVLRIASVLGSEFPFDLLQKVTEEEENILLTAVEEGLQVRVLRERRVAGAQALYSFADDQIRDALYEEISLVRAQGYHRKAGIALERAGVGDQPDGAEILSHHYLRGNEPSKAQKYLVLAGNRASDLYAPEQAVGRYRAVLELLEKVPNERLRSEVLERLGSQLEKLGDTEAQVKAWEQAIDGYVRLGEDRKAGDLFRRLGMVRFRTHENPEEGKRLLSEAHRLLEKAPVSPELVRLYLDESDRAEAEGTAADAAVFLAKALEASDRVNDPGVRAEIRVRRGGFAPRSDVDRFRKELAQDLEYGILHDSEIALLAYWQFASLAAFSRGDFLEARDWVTKGIAFAEKIRNVHWAMQFKGVALPFVSITLGDQATADRCLHEYRDFLEAHHQPPDGRNLRLLGEMAMLRGDLEEAGRLFEGAAAASSPFQPWLSEALLVLDWAQWESLQDHFARAEERLTTAMPAIRTSSVKGLSWFLEIWSLALLVEVLARQGAGARAAPFLAELERAVNDAGSDAGRGLLLRAKGQVLLAAGHLDQAAAHFEQSIAAWQASGCPIERARTEIELAKARRTQGARESSRQAAERAMELLKELPTGLDFQRAAAILGALPPP